MFAPLSYPTLYRCLLCDLASSWLLFTLRSTAIYCTFLWDEPMSWQLPAIEFVSSWVHCILDWLQLLSLLVLTWLVLHLPWLCFLHISPFFWFHIWPRLPPGKSFSNLTLNYTSHFLPQTKKKRWGMKRDLVPSGLWLMNLLSHCSVDRQQGKPKSSNI